MTSRCQEWHMQWFRLDGLMRCGTELSPDTMVHLLQESCVNNWHGALCSNIRSVGLVEGVRQQSHCTILGILVLERGCHPDASGIQRVTRADHQVDAYFVPTVVEPGPERLHEELC